MRTVRFISHIATTRLTADHTMNAIVVCSGFSIVVTKAIASAFVAATTPEPTKITKYCGNSANR